VATFKKGVNSPGYKENNDYYTPEWIFDALGETYDLDVCAPTGGVPWLPAKNHYDLEADGLVQPWHGFVWCNPPYSKPTPFIDKFLAHGYGIMLVQVSKSNAFVKLWNEAHGICLLPPKLKFVHKEHGLKGIFMSCVLVGMSDRALDAMKRANFTRVR
jgi:hypothetical protein